jgi:hypothetical protein
MRKRLWKSLSDNAISRRIQDMSADAESQGIANIKGVFCFAIQFDESTDITGNLNSQHSALSCY